MPRAGGTLDPAAGTVLAQSQGQRDGDAANGGASSAACAPQGPGALAHAPRSDGCSRARAAASPKVAPAESGGARKKRGDAPKVAAFRRRLTPFAAPRTGRSPAPGPFRRMLTSVFADGTPASGPDFDVDAIPARAWLALLAERPPRRVIPWNPPAAAVHRAEAGAPWRRAGEKEVADDLEKARVRARAAHAKTRAPRRTSLTHPLGASPPRVLSLAHPLSLPSRPTHCCAYRCSPRSSGSAPWGWPSRAARA